MALGRENDLRHHREFEPKPTPPRNGGNGKGRGGRARGWHGREAPQGGEQQLQVGPQGSQPDLVALRVAQPRLDDALHGWGQGPGPTLSTEYECHRHQRLRSFLVCCSARDPTLHLRGELNQQPFQPVQILRSRFKSCGRPARALGGVVYSRMLAIWSVADGHHRLCGTFDVL